MQKASVQKELGIVTQSNKWSLREGKFPLCKTEAERIDRWEDGYQQNNE